MRVNELNSQGLVGWSDTLSEPIQIPPPDHIKFTKDGCAYVDIDWLIDSVLEQIGVNVPAQPQLSRNENKDQNEGHPQDR